MCQFQLCRMGGSLVKAGTTGTRQSSTYRAMRSQETHRNNLTVQAFMSCVRRPRSRRAATAVSSAPRWYEPWPPEARALPHAWTRWRSTMSSPQPPATRRRITSILWFPIFFAIALPVTFEAVYHPPQPHGVPIPVVGHASQVSLMTGELHGVSASGFEVRHLPSAATASAAVRDRQVAAAYVA